MSNRKQREKPQYVGGSRNPITRSGADAPADPDAPPPDSDAPAKASPAHRMGHQVRQPLLGWILALVGFLSMLMVIVQLWANGGQRQSAPQAVAAPTRAPVFAPTPTAEASQMLLGEAMPADQQAQQTPQAAPTAAIPAVGSVPDAPGVGAGFHDYYNAHGGLDILGVPISAPLTVNGREIQWFERARVERWPEYVGTPYEVQLGRLGVEYTAGRQFASQQFFVSQPDMRFFAETGHALGGAFLTFWAQSGGLDVFGLPISEEFDEVLPDGKAYRVQYFERARLELHSEAAGTPYEVQAGLLGTALYRNESRPKTIQPVPTVVPLP